MHIKLAKPMTIFGDMDILLQLKMHEISLPTLTHFVPHRELLKYCQPVSL